jgi:4-hydroxy-2-oxoglutarate aldolase
MLQPTIDLAGVFPPIATPFGADGSLDVAHLRSNIERWSATRLAGFVVMGSNGEFTYLSDREKIDLLEAARSTIPAGRLMIAGTGCEGTEATVALTRRAADLGADAALVITPHFYRSRMDGRALVTYYRRVADASPIPVMLYNMPANTGIDMAVDTIATLAEHPNIIGLKDSSGNIVKLGEVIRAVPSSFQVVAGSASFLYTALALGAVGGIVALSNVAPEACVLLYESFRRGDLPMARTVQLKLLRANAAVTSRFGVPGLKAAMDMVGYYGGPPRPPLLPLPEPDREALRSVLVEAEVL